MKKSLKISLGGIIALLLSLVIIVGSLGNALQSSKTSSLFTDVTESVNLYELMQKYLNGSVMTGSEAKVYENRTVLISLKSESLTELSGNMNVSDYALTSEGKAQTEKMHAEQDEFLAKLSDAGIEYVLEYRYVAVDNAIAVEINTEYVSKIREMSGVDSVVIANTYAYPETTTSSSGDAVENITSIYGTGIYDSSDCGLDGSGMLVAILDTGLDYTHSAFQTMPETVKYTYNDIVKLLADKDFSAEARQLLSSGILNASDVYINAKVPFAYDYADNDADVYPSYSNHGTHVAGIIAGYDEAGYTDKNGNHVDETFIGVAPNAQFVICKVFTDDLEDDDLGGAETEDILAALEDCILLGVDVINMSLGTTCGFSTSNDGDDEGEYLQRVYDAIASNGISLVCAASNDYSAGSGSTFGTNLSSNPDSGTVGSPATYASALAVASISGKKSGYIIANGSTPIFFENSNDENSNPFDFVSSMLGNATEMDFEYVVIPGTGSAADYTVGVQSLIKGRIALVKRGDSTFQEKVEIAKSFGAIGIIVYNNVAGTVKMSLGDVENPIPAISVNMNAGETLVSAAKNRVGTITINAQYQAGPFMSDFSSWGCTPDLKLKPEITAHGGEITSTVPGGYDEMSGTSMACPNMAGVVTLLRSYIQNNVDLTQHKKTAKESDSVTITRLVNQLLMSTATTIYDQDGLAYSPRKQGSGLGSLSNALSTGAYLWFDNESIDYRPKAEIGDDKNKTGEYTFDFYLTNFGGSTLTFKVQTLFMTETLAINGLAVAEQAYMLDDIAAQWTVNGATLKDGDSFSVADNTVTKITIKLALSDTEKNYIDESFENGMFVEGFIKLLSDSKEQCDLVLPFLGFYGDWSQAPMLDYSAYELAKYQQDSSIADDEKPQASVWATQPYTTYYNDEYVIPMGSFLYLQDENADQIYADEEHNAISCFNQYYGEDEYNNYLTTYKMRGLYVGLLRNARAVYYTLYNTTTGEVLKNETIYRVGKAYANGGSATPAFVELNLDPLELNMASGEQYTMSFEFELDYEDGSANKNTYSFSFYVDYEAPVLQDVRVRYYDYKDGNKTKQKIYLDLDVYDNHYAQSVMLTYLEDAELKLATEYVTPIYNANKNGTTTVSIEITDLYDKYKDSFYIQIDDYALNHSVYWLNLSECNQSLAPDHFELADGEAEIELDIYETHTVSLSYSGEGNLSNFKWSSNNRSVADVKNGEIVGLSAGTATITIEGSNGSRQTVKVVVKETSKTLATPSISFGTILDGDEKIVKAQGAVAVYPGYNFNLEVQTDPWYYPIDQLTLNWVSTNPTVATVDQNGNVLTLQKGSAVIQAFIVVNGVQTAYSTSVTLKVQDPFEVSSYSLVKYHGQGGVVVIPSDRNIMMIGEDAFKDNDTITEIIIPKSVTSIGKSAFENCTALTKIYFVDTETQEIADADVSVIYSRAFYGCTSLELVDFSNIKVVTLGRECFAHCISLKEIKRMDKIGTAYDNVFYGCTSLTDIDITGLGVCGSFTFAGCTSLTNVKTSNVTKLGSYAFYGCTSLKDITLHGSQIGPYAFYGCSSLSKVTLAPASADESISVTIGAYAFFDCKYLSSFTCESNCSVLSIGDYAFANTELTSFTLPVGLNILGTNILSGTSVSEITLNDDFDLEAVRLTGIPFSQLKIKLSDDCTKYVIENGVLYNKDKTSLLLVLNGTTSVTIPNTVKNIGAYAFAGSSVTNINIPASVTTIGEFAFADSKLEIVTFASGSTLTCIPDSAFSGTRIATITIPENVKEIGASAFANSNLTEIIFSGNKLETIGSYAFYGCNGLGTIVLPDTVNTMGSEVFEDCKRLESVTLPSLKSLGSYTFYGCDALTTVIFGDNTTTLGDYTFYYCEALETVSLGNKLTEIGQGVFFGCSSLASIDLKNVTDIESEAFAYCTNLAIVNGLENVKTIGNMTFYNNNSIKALNLTSAVTIGNGAFAIENGGSAYTSIYIPSVKEIGIMAFAGGKETTLTLPATLEKLGYGAFTSSKKLKAFTIESGNENFFVLNGVLFRKLTSATYELSAFPGGMSINDNTYTVPDGTVSIAAYAFADLSKKSPSKVVLPWSLKLIGASAFYNSGILDYTFNSIQAPTLSTVYREDVMEIMESLADNSTFDSVAVNGLFYANFNTLLVNYTKMVGETSNMTISFPENGTGYDNYIYSTYFGKTISLGVVMDDTTRDAISAIEGLESVETVRSWLSWEVNDTNLTQLQEAIELVKEARRLYNNISGKDQLAYISGDLVTKLTDIETIMRDLKQKFGIKLVISDIKANTDYKKDYVEGDTFDLNGLILTIVYDDGSTELADLSKLTLISPLDGLTRYDAEVKFSYQYGDSTSDTYTVRIKVNVTGENDTTAGETPPPDDNDSNALIYVFIAIGAVIVLGGAAVAVIFFYRKKKASNAITINEQNINANDVSAVEETKAEEATAESTNKPEIEVNNPENDNTEELKQQEKEPINWHPILKWVGIGLATVAVVALIVIGVRSCGSSSNEDPLSVVEVSINYHANGGSFDNNHTEKSIGYQAGSYALNIGFQELTNGNADIKNRDGYEFEGWYLAETDSKGNLVYEDEAKTIVKTCEKFDFSQRLSKGQNYDLYAKWVKSKYIAVYLVGTNITDSSGTLHTEGSLLRELVFQNGKTEKYSGSRLLDLERKAYTFVEYYLDEACTQPVSWPIIETEAEVTPVYAKFIEGDWNIVSDASSAKSMLGSLAGNGKYYVIADIDLNGEAITTASTVLATVVGNGHTISNFKVNKTNVSQNTSLLGTMKASASITDLSLENVSLTVNVRSGIVGIYFIFTEVENGSEIKSLTVTGDMTVNYASGATVTNLQPKLHDTWIIGGDDQDIITSGNITAQATCLIDGQTYKYPVSDSESD